LKNEKLNILLFSTKGAGEHYYGPGISAYRLYQGLDFNQANLYLAHGYKDQADLDIFTEQHFISDLTGGGLFGGLEFYIKMKKWVALNVGKFDVVHCIGAFHASFLLAMAFRRKNIPVFIKITESEHTGFTKSSTVSKLLGMQRFRKKNANVISGYISISSEITRNLTEAGIEKNKIHHIPNGVDTDKFSPVTEKVKVKVRKKLLLPNQFTFLFAGAFSDRKNPLLVAKAFQPFFNQKNVQLVLIGPDRDDGDQRLKIEQLIARNNVDNVIVRGHQKDIEFFINLLMYLFCPRQKKVCRILCLKLWPVVCP